MKIACLLVGVLVLSFAVLRGYAQDIWDDSAVSPFSVFTAKSLKLTDEQRHQLQSIAAETRKEQLKLMQELLVERYTLRSLSIADEIDPKAIGDAYGRVVAVKLCLLKSTVASLEKYESTLTEDQRKMLSDTTRVEPRYAKPQPQEVTPTGGRSGGGSSAPVCEYVGDQSQVMNYVCTSQVDPGTWAVCWKNGGCTRYYDPQPVPIS